MSAPVKTLAVLGMHRSGTSALARCVNLIGVDWGPEGGLTEAIAHENPKGFWEHKKISIYNCDALEFIRELDRRYKEDLNE